MTKIIGLTGGMGSGKTTVAKMFMELGIPFYFADEAGREILRQSDTIEILRDYFGEDIIIGGQIDRAKLSAIVFNNSEKLEFLNGVVHPRVRKDYKLWLEKNKAEKIVMKESALLFESGADADCDLIITVSVPEEVRIKRVQKRDNITNTEIRLRLSKQFTDQQREERSDFIILNNEIAETRTQVENIFNILSNS